MLDSASMPTDRKARRAALAQEARRIASEVEQLYISLAEKGDLSRIRSFDGVPNFDLLQTAKAR